MNISYKLKIRQQPNSTNKEQSMVRRIRTDHLDGMKKNSKQPLADNRRLTNYNQSGSQVSKNTKKTTAIKSVLNKNSNSQANYSQYNYSRLTTQPTQKPYYHHTRTATATDKLISSSQGHRKTNTVLNLKKKETQKDSFSKGTQALKTKNDSLGVSSNSEVGKCTGAQRYDIEKKVGSGTFGTVHKARDKKSLEIVAIKKVYQDKNYKNRELDILKMLHHPNVLSMKDSFFTYEKESGKEFLNVVMDYYQLNLYESIKKNTKRTPMPRLKFKMYAYQLFRSLLYLKSLNIAHRDIKPQNILVDEERLKLVMCDFGSAKILKAGQPNIAYICSRCYRAPELIFGNTQYTTQIDMWSVGCVLAEMLICQPLFQGDSNIDQLAQIIKVLGCPTSKQIRQMSPEYDTNKFQLPKIVAKTWNKIFPNGEYLGQEFIDLMKNVLCYSPRVRFTPLDALGHSFFDQLRKEEVYRSLQDKYSINSLFDFSETQETSYAELKKLIPCWYS